MTIVTLEINKSRHISVHSRTFEPLFNHPVLEINFSDPEVRLKPDVEEWLNEKFHDMWSFGFDKDIGKYYIWLDNESDATMFALRWS